MCQPLLKCGLGVKGWAGQKPCMMQAGPFLFDEHVLVRPPSQCRNPPRWHTAASWTPVLRSTHASSVFQMVKHNPPLFCTLPMQESSEVAYGRKLDSYFALNTRAAAAYAGYACLYTFLPSAVSAVVLFYGGNLVLQGKVRSKGCRCGSLSPVHQVLCRRFSVKRQQSGASKQGWKQGV